MGRTVRLRWSLAQLVTYFPGGLRQAWVDGVIRQITADLFNLMPVMGDRCVKQPLGAVELAIDHIQHAVVVHCQPRKELRDIGQ